MIESCKVLPNLKVYVSGSNDTEKVKFVTLSKTGDIVDAFEAMKLAETKM